MPFAPELYLAKEAVELSADMAHVTGYTEASGEDVWISGLVAHDGDETGFVFLDLDSDAFQVIDYYGVQVIRDELKRLVQEELDKRRSERFARNVLNRLLS